MPGKTATAAGADSRPDTPPKKLARFLLDESRSWSCDHSSSSGFQGGSLRPFFRPSGHRARITAKTSHSRRAAPRDRVDSAVKKRITPLANRPGMHHTGARDALFQRAKGADRGIGKPNRMAQEMLDYW